MTFVKFKKTHPEATRPVYAKEGDACVDLVAVKKWHDDYGNVCYDTGIAVQIPPCHVGLLFPRSSVSKTGMQLRNSVGVIDSGYRGSIIAKFKRDGGTSYDVGDRVCQLMIMPLPMMTFLETDELEASLRGARGFGSTGN